MKDSINTQRFFDLVDSYVYHAVMSALRFRMSYCKEKMHEAKTKGYTNSYNYWSVELDKVSYAYDKLF